MMKRSSRACHHSQRPALQRMCSVHDWICNRIQVLRCGWRVSILDGDADESGVLFMHVGSSALCRGLLVLIIVGRHLADAATDGKCKNVYLIYNINVYVVSVSESDVESHLNV